MKIADLKNTITKIKTHWVCIIVEWRWWKIVWLLCCSTEILLEKAKVLQIATSFEYLLIFLKLIFTASTLSSPTDSSVNSLGSSSFDFFLDGSVHQNFVFSCLRFATSVVLSFAVSAIIWGAFQNCCCTCATPDS